MPNRWYQRDILQLTRNCELGDHLERLHVISVSGPYMTVRHESGLLIHTGRDYAHATKVGEAATDDAPAIVASNARDVLAGLVRDYFDASEEFEACNIVAQPARSRVAATKLERAETLLREAAGATTTEPTGPTGEG